MFEERLRSINDTEYFIERLELRDLDRDLFIPFKELASIKKQILTILNASKKHMDPIGVPSFKKRALSQIRSTLALLISTKEDLHLRQKTRAHIYFQLPDCMSNEFSGLVNLFKANQGITAWFPSVLIGEDFIAAVEFLQQVQPKHIVTNNTGIAYKAFELGIPWIAGPHLNLVNSFSLLCMKEEFGCSGAFISNEISKMQIKKINPPDDFDLFYSIYHPIVLMTSRQCLFHQVTGCEKNKIDNSCLSQCEKFSFIENMKHDVMFIEKSKSNYHKIYNGKNYLNTEIVTDMPHHFSSFLIDLREMNTETSVACEKIELVQEFEKLPHISIKHISKGSGDFGFD